MLNNSTFGERFRQLRRSISNSLKKSIPKWQIEAPSSRCLPTKPDSVSPLSGPVMDDTIKAMDGVTERSRRQGHSPQSRSHISAIFVHAGAGYHSTTNEHIHLGACDEYVCTL